MASASTAGSCRGCLDNNPAEQGVRIAGQPVLTVPTADELRDGQGAIERVRDIEPDDLPGREPVQLDEADIGNVPPVFLNGKFLAQTTTGVQRVAMSLLQALDALPGLAQGRTWVLLHPPGTTPPPLHQIHTRRVGWAGLPLHVWEQSVLPWASRQGLLLNLAGAAPALARRQVCHIHDAAIYDCPLTYSWRFRLWYRCLFALLAWRRIPLLTVSEFSRQRLCLHLDLPAARIAVLPNGVDHLDAVLADASVLSRLGLQGQRYLLAVASDSPGKNLATLLQAYARLPVGSCRLVLVGSPRSAVFRSTGAPVQTLPDGAVHAGAVDDAALKALYQHATALVVPSLYEGFCLPAVEAMRLDCPVVAANVAALPEVCGDAALTFDPRSVDDLVTVLARVLADCRLRDQFRLAGRARVASATWQRSAQRLSHIADQVGQP